MSWRVAKRITVFCLVVAAGVSIPILRSTEVRSIDAPWLATLLLLAWPMGVAIAFPFAMVMAVDAIRRAEGLLRRWSGPRQ